MFRTYGYDLARVSNQEDVVDVVSGVAGKTRRVVSALVEAGTDYTFRGYLDTDRVVDVPMECDAVAFVPIPIDVELKEGQTFRAGWLDRAAAVTPQAFAIVVEEK